MDLISLARQLGLSIQQSDEYITYKVKEQNMQCDKELQKIIEDFNLKKVSINHEISKENVDQAKIDKLNSEIGELYNKIMENNTMKIYNEAKQKFEETLRKVSLIINSASAGEDPMTVNVDEDLSCTGSCEGCSGCA